MEKRINMGTAVPHAFKAMCVLEESLAQVSFSKTVKALIKIRASQINNCAYCIDMHSKEALKNGETAQRIFLVSAWKEATRFFTNEEQTVLAMTEEITLVHQHGLSDATYTKAMQFFNEVQIAEIIMTIVIINAWNRIVVSTHQEIQ